MQMGNNNGQLLWKYGMSWARRLPQRAFKAIRVNLHEIVATGFFSTLVEIGTTLNASPFQCSLCMADEMLHTWT